MASLKDILVVDDEMSIVQLCEIVLNYAGYKVRGAYGGEEALSLIEKGKPDLILLDVMMPGMDGIQVCKTVRKESEKLPYIVMYTADDRASTHDACKEAGANYVLTKDTPVSELPTKLESLAESFGNSS